MKTLQPNSRPVYLNASGDKGFQGDKINLLAGEHGSINIRNKQRKPSDVVNQGGVARVIQKHPNKMAIVLANTGQEIDIIGTGHKDHFYGIETFGSWGIVFIGDGSLWVSNVSLDGNNNGFAGIMAKSDNKPDVQMQSIMITDVKARRFTGEGLYIGQSTSDPKRYHRISQTNIAHFIGTDMFREIAQLRHVDNVHITNSMSLRGGLANKRDQNFNWQIIDSYGTMENCVFVHDMPSQVWNIHTTGLKLKNNVVVGHPGCDRLAYFGQNVELGKDKRIDSDVAYDPIVIDTLFGLNFNESKELFKVANSQVPIVIKDLVTDKNYQLLDVAHGDAKIEVLNHTVKEDLPLPKFSSWNKDLLSKDCFYAKMGIGLDEYYGTYEEGEPEPEVIQEELEPEQCNLSEAERDFLQERLEALNEETQILTKLLNN